MATPLKPGPTESAPRGRAVGPHNPLGSAVSLLPQPAGSFGASPVSFCALRESEAPMPTQEQITEALRVVIDPELRHNIVDLGMVRSIEQPSEGRVDVVISLTTPGCPIRSHFQKGVATALRSLPGVSSVNVGFDVLTQQEKGTLQQRLGRRDGLPTGALAAVKNVVCVGSGKGGVGKSTVTSNLACALALEGMQAAAMDADVWGYSIPRMLGVHGRPRVSEQRKILPLVAHGGVKAISIE